MKKTNIFDDVMDYIDENIKCKYTDVKKGIHTNFAYTIWIQQILIYCNQRIDDIK